MSSAILCAASPWPARPGNAATAHARRAPVPRETTRIRLSPAQTTLESAAIATAHQAHAPTTRIESSSELDSIISSSATTTTESEIGYKISNGS
jgi:hypothetical protein